MKQLFHITPFDVTESKQPVLSMRVGEKHCSFAIADLGSLELKQLAYYSADEIDENFLIELFNAYTELGGPFYQVLICYDYLSGALVPMKHYKYEDAALFLKALYGINNAATIMTDPVKQFELHNVYAVPKDIHHCISQKFPTAKYGHNYSLAVKSITGADTQGCLCVDLGTNNFTLIAGRENKLLLAQSFSYSVPEDILYYLLKVCQQLGFSQQEVKLILSGLIEKQSSLFKELHQYFMHIEFRETSWSNSEYPAHFFTSLNDLARCAS